ncbi:MAG TPA: hypothetical protein VM487_07900 [Phycisphaerae bacterium]|nr:hypothetical protein [Phycisphaerae bacterium]
MPSRDDAILTHIGLYRISLRYVIEKLFFDGRNCGNVLQRLIERKRIQSVAGLHGSLRYYQLTLSEARHRNLPQDRGRAFGPRALAAHLAVLWFCCVAPVPRRRLEAAELRELFDRVPSGCPHVGQAGSKPCIHRVYVVNSRTRTADVIKRLRAEIDDAAREPHLGAWIANKRYAFTLLTDSRPRAEALYLAVRRAELPRIARVHSQGVPSPLTVQAAIQDIREPTLPPAHS